MLFRPDPPYWGCAKHYGQDVFGRDAFDRRATLLAFSRGKLLLSINDTSPERATVAALA